MGGIPLNKPVVGLASTPDNKGYWEVASDGGIFSFGDAPSTARRLHHPQQADRGHGFHAERPGYWLVASDGGIFNYGDAHFFGSMGGKPLTTDRRHGCDAGRPGVLEGGQRRRDLLLRGRPLPRLDGRHHPQQADRGHGRHAGGSGVLAGGQRRGHLQLQRPLLGSRAALASTSRWWGSPPPDGQGYWLVASDGGIFNFGEQPFFGSMRRHSPSTPRWWASRPTRRRATTEKGGQRRGHLQLTPLTRPRGGQPLNAPIVGLGAG